MSRDVERILQAVPIDGYIGKYVALKRKGNNLWGLCPFHNEKTPSFSVSPEKGIFKCFGCGKGGNVISFVMEYERLAFPEALRLLAEYAGITLEERGSASDEQKDKKKALADLQVWVAQLYQKQLPQSKADVYLKERGVTAGAIEHFKIGYAPNDFRFLENKLQQLLSGNPEKQKVALENLHLLGLLGTSQDSRETYNRFRGRLIFPIHDLQGNTIAFGGRILEARENTGKYINSPDSVLFQKKNTLFHLFEAKDEIRRAGTAILVEGYFDVLGLWERNIKNAVAPLGTAFTPEQAKLLKRYTDRVILFFDSDNAGIEAAFKAMNVGRGNQLTVRVTNIDSGQGKTDPFDLSRQKTTDELLMLLDDARDELSFTLWYFFHHKYNISQLSEKKRAVGDFFAHLDTLSSELERISYLEAAAPVLQIELALLKQDFRQKAKGAIAVSPSSREKEEVSKAPQVLNRSEKDIIALLLKYPNLWSKEDDLLKEHHWETENGFLLYSFFRDRFLGGEAWDWDHLTSVINLLPVGLQNDLSGLIIEYEEVFQSEQQVNSTEAEARKRLREILLTARVRELDRRQQSLLRELKIQEKVNSPKAEELALELDDVQKKAAKLRVHLLEKKN